MKDLTILSLAMEGLLTKVPEDEKKRAEGIITNIKNIIKAETNDGVKLIVWMTLIMEYAENLNKMASGGKEAK